MAFTIDITGFQFFEGAPDHTSFINEDDIREKSLESFAPLRLLTRTNQTVPFATCSLPALSSYCNPSHHHGQ